MDKAIKDMTLLLTQLHSSWRDDEAFFYCQRISPTNYAIYPNALVG